MLSIWCIECSATAQFECSALLQPCHTALPIPQPKIKHKIPISTIFPFPFSVFYHHIIILSSHWFLYFNNRFLPIIFAVWTHWNVVQNFDSLIYRFCFQMEGGWCYSLRYIVPLVYWTSGLLVIHFTRCSSIHYVVLSRKKNAIHLLLKNPEKICWTTCSRNPNARVLFFVFLYFCIWINFLFWVLVFWSKFIFTFFSL